MSGNRSRKGEGSTRAASARAVGASYGLLIMSRPTADKSAQPPNARTDIARQILRPENANERARSPPNRI